MSQFHRICEWLHLYLGLAAAPMLVLLGLTGTYLTFEYPLDRAMNPTLNYVQVGPARASLQQLVDAALAAHPKGRVSTIAMSAHSPAPDLSYMLQLSEPGAASRSVYVDPYTAHVLGERQSRTFSTIIHDLHTNLLTGEDGPGSIVIMFATFLVIPLAITGLILWWPRKILSVRWNASSKRITFDLHNAVGLYSFIFLLIFGITGLVIHWQSVVMPALNHALHIDDSEPTLHASATLPGRPRPTLDEIATAAEHTIPGARITQIALPKSTGVYRIWMRYPEDSTPLGRTNLLIDPNSGAVLWQRTSRAAPTTTRYFRQWNREIHTGDILGWPGRIIVSLMSLALPVLAVTGPLFWLRRRRRVKRAAYVATAP